MLKNAALDAKIGVDPAENEPPKECCVVASSPLVEPLEQRVDLRRGAWARASDSGRFGFQVPLV